MPALEIIGAPQSNYVWAVRMVCEEKGVPYDHRPERPHSPDEDPGEMLELLRALKRSHLALWARTSPSERARVGIHSERGPESFELSFRLLSGHGLFHLGQMRRTLAQVAGSGSSR